MNFSRKSQTPSTEGGFTLIEVLVIVIIVGVLAAIAGPSWLGYLTRQRMGTVQNDLVEVLKQAQTDASQLRTPQTVVVNTTANVPTVSVNGVAKKLAAGNIPSGSILLSASSTPATIEFDYRGLPPVSSVPFVISISPNVGTSKRCVIVTSLLGTVRTAKDTQCNGVTAASVDSK